MGLLLRRTKRAGETRSRRIEWLKQGGPVSGFNRIMTTAAGVMSLGAMVFAAGVSAAEQNVREKSPTARKASFAPPETATSRPSFEGVARGMPAGSDNMLVFSAPPRETEEEGI